jgi:hypothetical protein
MNIHWSLWVALAVLVLIVIILSSRREGYAPPRDENTNPPYTEQVGNTVTTSNNLPYVDSTSNVFRADNQTDVYKDMGGMDYQIQAGNPILNFIQGDPSSNVMYGDFVPHESDGGSARMYAYGVESNVLPEGDMLPPVPTMTSNIVPVVGVDIKGSPIMPVAGVDIESRSDIPDAGQYIPELTSPSIPFLGNQPGISASESPASMTSPEVAQ